MEKSYRIYFAGGLFSHKDLIGNAQLAHAIDDESDGKYKCVLPQNLEARKSTSKDIRDGDISAVLHSDLAIFNFDGAELDSGTLVEFMFAKFADIASLIIRSDFRGGGDCQNSEEYLPWNLMASFYPRTETLVVNAMEIYKEQCFNTDAMVREMTKRILPRLDKLVKLPPQMPPHLRDGVYEWLAFMPNFDEDRIAEMKSIMEKKKLKSLL